MDSASGVSAEIRRLAVVVQRGVVGERRSTAAFLAFPGAERVTSVVRSDSRASKSSDGRTQVARFCENESSLVDLVTRFLGEGLQAGRPVLVIASESHRAALLRSLESVGFDTAAACERGRFVLLDARETLAACMVGDMPDWRRFKQRVGGQLERLVAGRAAPVRVFGEMVDLLWRGGNRRAAIRLEEMWDDLARAHPLSFRHAYTMGDFYREDPAHFRAVTHRITSPGSDAAADEPREMARLRQRVRSLEAEVDHRRELEEALRWSLAEVRRSEDRKDAFMAMLGHELRNPLAPMLTALQLMNVRGDPSNERERDVLERQVRHMMQLVDDMLDISRVAGGKLDLQREPIEIADVISRAVEMTSPLYDEKRHGLAVRIPAPGLAVDADAMRLAQVFANLLTNAAKYTNPGGHVDVVGAGENGSVVITIRDSGVGIAPELLPRVFDRFVQAEDGCPPSGGGLGLGLAIVHMLVELHGGVVTAHSDGVGKGSTFVVRLPAIASAKRDAHDGRHGERSRKRQD